MTAGVHHDPLFSSGDCIAQSRKVSESESRVDKQGFLLPHDQVHPHVAPAVQAFREKAVDRLPEPVDLDMGVNRVYLFRPVPPRRAFMQARQAALAGSVW